MSDHQPQTQSPTVTSDRSRAPAFAGSRWSRHPHVVLASDDSSYLKSVTSPPFRGDGTDCRDGSRPAGSEYVGCLTRRSVTATPGDGSKNGTSVVLELVGACFHHRREKLRIIFDAGNSIEYIRLRSRWRRGCDTSQRIPFVIRCSFV